MSLTLYSYFRSSAAYRVRIALNLKGLPYEVIPVHLVKDGGQQHQAAFQAINPAELVPALGTGQQVLNQSLAIIEYLEELQPKPALLPGNALERAQIRALALDIACDIHPLNNLRVLQYLSGTLQVSEDTKASWYHHWIQQGFDALEQRLSQSPSCGQFCFGDSPTLADCCLIPQLTNARRFNGEVSRWPTLTRIEANAMQLSAFQQAAPEQQVDAE